MTGLDLSRVSLLMSTYPYVIDMQNHRVSRMGKLVCWRSRDNQTACVKASWPIRKGRDIRLHMPNVRAGIYLKLEKMFPSSSK